MQMNVELGLIEHKNFYKVVNKCYKFRLYFKNKPLSHNTLR